MLWLQTLAEGDQTVLPYLQDEEWTHAVFKGPRQQDGYNCGVFVLMIFDFLLDDLNEKSGFDWNDALSKHINYFRTKITIDLWKRSLNYE